MNNSLMPLDFDYMQYNQNVLHCILQCLLDITFLPNGISKKILNELKEVADKLHTIIIIDTEKEGMQKYFSMTPEIIRLKIIKIYLEEVEKEKMAKILLGFNC